MDKRGQFRISIGMIFSIIIIVATITVAIYAITFFLDFGKCSRVGIFYKDLEGKVNEAWRSDITRETFTGSLPSGTDYVCFGNLTQSVSDFDPRDEVRQNELRRGGGTRRNNLFIYPPGICKGVLASFNLERAEADGFFCLEVSRGKIDIKLRKDVTDSLVSLQR